MTPFPALPIDPIGEAHRQWVAHGWAPAADGMATVTSIMRAQQLLLARVDEALRPLGLSFARYELLQLLNFTREGALPMKSASARLQVHPTSVTATVDRLARDGFARRRPDPRDGRAVLVEITDAGRTVVADATERLNRQVFERLDMPTEDRTALLDALTRFRRQAGDFVETAPLGETSEAE